MTQFKSNVNCVNYNFSQSRTKKTTTKTRKKSNAPRRFALQIGKNISLAMMAERYGIDGDGGAK